MPSDWIKKRLGKEKELVCMNQKDLLIISKALILKNNHKKENLEKSCSLPFDLTKLNHLKSPK